MLQFSLRLIGAILSSSVVYAYGVNPQNYVRTELCPGQYRTEYEFQWKNVERGLCNLGQILEAKRAGKARLQDRCRLDFPEPNIAITHVFRTPDVNDIVDAAQKMGVKMLCPSVPATEERDCYIYGLEKDSSCQVN